MKKRSLNEIGLGFKQAICLSHKEFCGEKDYTQSNDRIHCAGLYFNLNIIIVPYEDIRPCYKRAKEIMKNIDQDDAVFLALALCNPNDGIWTEDAHFEKQNIVKVWKTTDLTDVLGLGK